SMGIRDKDSAVMEFFSFNKACQMVCNQGFNTFLKIDNAVYEAFKQSDDSEISQKMLISAGELELEEINNTLGIRVNVTYFPFVNLPVAGLVRRVSIRNLRKKLLGMEIIDGLPHILAFGMTQHSIKFISSHIEAMIKVDNVDGTPLFKLKQVPRDTSQIQKIESGNFYFTFMPDEGRILKDNYIVDHELIFGISGGFDYPWTFAKNSVEKILDSNQMYENKASCALTLLRQDIPAGNKISFYSFIGNTSSKEKLKKFKSYIADEGVIENKREENRRVIEEIEDNIFTVSGNKNFDSYCGQTFLDNVMRGGLPVVFKTPESKNIFYLYSRKHGDLERDYNFFVLEQTYLSQGNSHFRDVNQNRRNDVWFNPEVEDNNIIMFYNMLQTDGFNPLVVNGLTYTAENVSELRTWLGGIVKDNVLLDDLLEMVKEPFTPGKFIMKLEERVSDISLSYDKVVAALLSFCKENDVGQPREGFWIDHWTYNQDLIDNFLMIFPERLKEIVEKKIYTFYDNPDIVMPRDKKYVLVDGKVRQYEAVQRNEEKEEMIKSRKEHPNKVRREHGRGEIYRTNLLVKMLCLIANKIASLDPEGIGVEMEADKPGWNDPLNGLPGLIASAINETLELRRTCAFLSDAISKIEIKDDESVNLFEDMYIFITALMKAIDKRLNSTDKDRAFIYWDESYTIKEEYREKTVFGISGKEKGIKVSDVKDFLDKCLRLLDSIFTDMPREKVFHEKGLCYTYFLNEVTKHEHICTDSKTKELALNKSGLPLVKPLEFRQKPVTLFLEGPVHLMKIRNELAGEIYRNIRKSEIYDKKLKMYKTSEPITSESFEIGRARAYLPGWIENESVYLHMEYKYLLEILKAELYEEFYEEIQNTLIPFLNPETYGRSILENCSFIVSSAFPDRELHGRGFQPRLSGATAELLNMWIIMVAGQNPFFLDKSKSLKLKLKPILPHWLFTGEQEKCRIYTDEGKPVDITVPANCFAFKFLGRIIVIYRNDKRRSTFGKNAAKIASYTLQYADG
ncbi:MAG: hypothetical protein V3T96_02760, partial [Thermodesulfobacteriota bacterium]